MRRLSITLLFLGLAIASLCLAVKAQQVDPRVVQEEAKRAAAVEKVRPAVVAIFSQAGAGGGSAFFAATSGIVAPPSEP